MALEYTFYGPGYRNSLGGEVSIVPGRELGTDTITVSGTSALGALAAPPGAAIVNLITGEDCRIAIGTAPVAARVAPKTRLLKSGNEYLFSVLPGDQIAVISA